MQAGSVEERGQAQRGIDPVTRRLGWTTTLCLPALLDGSRLHVERQWKTSSRSLFTIVVARNAKALPASVTRGLARRAQ